MYEPVGTAPVAVGSILPVYEAVPYAEGSTNPSAAAEPEDDLDPLDVEVDADVDVEEEEDDAAKIVVDCPLTTAARAASKM